MRPRADGAGRSNTTPGCPCIDSGRKPSVDAASGPGAEIGPKSAHTSQQTWWKYAELGPSWAKFGWSSTDCGVRPISIRLGQFRSGSAKCGRNRVKCGPNQQNVGRPSANSTKCCAKSGTIWADLGRPGPSLAPLRPNVGLGSAIFGRARPYARHKIAGRGGEIQLSSRPNRLATPLLPSQQCSGEPNAVVNNCGRNARAHM